MEDIVLKLREIEDFFQEITCEMLGIDLSKKKIRIKLELHGQQEELQDGK
ncbi:hypothetical protein [Clostridium butyricum]